MTVKNDVIEYLRQFGPTSDAKLASALGLVHQAVNQTCRQLESDGIIRRDKSARPLQNVIVVAGQKATQCEPDLGVAESTEPELKFITEDEVKAAVQQLLEHDGYTVTVRWGHDHGIDIEAHHDRERLIIEAKGETKKGPQQRNYFTNALGEVVERLTDPHAKYGIALPDNSQYRGLVERLAPHVWERLNFCVFFVARSGNELTVERLDAPPR